MSDDEPRVTVMPPQKKAAKCSDCEKERDLWLKATAIVTVLYVGICIGVTIAEARH